MTISRRDFFAMMAPANKIEKYRIYGGKRYQNEITGVMVYDYKYTEEEARYRFADAMIAASSNMDEASDPK